MSDWERCRHCHETSGDCPVHDVTRIPKAPPPEPAPSGANVTDQDRREAASLPCEWCGSTEGAHGDAYVCIVYDPAYPTEPGKIPGTVYLPSREAIAAAIADARAEGARRERERIRSVVGVSVDTLEQADYGHIASVCGWTEGRCFCGIHKSSTQEPDDEDACSCPEPETPCQFCGGTPMECCDAWDPTTSMHGDCPVHGAKRSA